MNIDNIVSFIYVQRLKNFRKAAEKLYITQPSLSSRIKTLEKDLGVTLLNRNKNKVEITEDGEKFLPFAYEIYNSYLNAKATFQKTESVITVGSIISVSTSILPDAVYQYKNNNPHLTVEVITAKTETMLDKLLNNECQVIITETVDHPDIITEKIYEDTVSLFVNPSHAFANTDRIIGIEEIATEPLICFNSQSTYWQEIVNNFENRHLKPNIVFNIDSLEAAKSVILKDIGISFLPKLSLEKDIASGDLFKVDIDPDLEPKRIIYLSYRKDAVEDVQIFSEYLLEAIKQKSEKK